MPLLLDTGIVYALADRDDAWHERATELLRNRHEALLVAEVALAEVTYLLHRRLGPAVELAFVQSLAQRELSIESLAADDLARVAELLESYPDIGFVAAATVAIAERLELTEIATTDRRHFATVRPRHCEAFSLLPLSQAPATPS